MDSFRLVLRMGYLPQWSTETLERGLAAFERDDPFITQGSTTTPPPLLLVQDWPLEACCPVAYCCVEDPHSATVGEVEEAFAKSAFDCDQRVGEPVVCKWLLGWIDDAPRSEVMAELATEFRLELGRRREALK